MNLIMAHNNDENVIEMHFLNQCCTVPALCQQVRENGLGFMYYQR